jgi:hypothetical protein
MFSLVLREASLEQAVPNTLKTVTSWLPMIPTITDLLPMTTRAEKSLIHISPKADPLVASAARNSHKRNSAAVLNNVLAELVAAKAIPVNVNTI